MFCVYLVWLVYKFYNRWHNTSRTLYLNLTDHLKDINGKATEHSRMNPVQVKIGNNSSINVGDTCNL
ncbi:unnamed protein product [Callosobruchus maculatus]|uniref:Uncharacterized protein n=1 Tax=Callosobruchus maculatus TaxID=64391 RepID=A0A653DLN0_CALMS|nr:unnamed protein product [Callosobruchus maculatus]